MDERISAALHVDGHAIRFAEVVQRDSVLELQRFGECTFDFDVAGALWDEEGDVGALDRVEAAVSDELRGTTAQEIYLVVHPLDAFSFFTPMAPGLSERDRMRQVAQQAALLSGRRSPDALRVTPHHVRNATVAGDEVVQWMHVLALPKSVQQNVEQMLSGLEVPDRIRMVSTEATALVMAAVASSGQVPANTEAAPYSLAIGQYSGHTDFTLTCEGDWFHGHSTADTRSENRAYYAAGFLNRVGVAPESVRPVFTYGSEPNVSGGGPLADLFGVSPERLRPFHVMAGAEELAEDENRSAYVPCLGALLESVAG